MNTRIRQLRKTLGLKQKEFFDIFDDLSPILQDYLINTAKELLKTQARLQKTEFDREQ